MRSVLTIFIIFTIEFCYSQTASISNLDGHGGLISYTPSEVLLHPEKLRDLWATEAIPMFYYTQMDILMQKTINKKVSNSIITYSPEELDKEWIDIDYEVITPYTWKWIDLELQQKDGTKTKASLRRPNWWIKGLNIEGIGSKVYIHMPEMGINGWANVSGIRPNQLDMRIWDEQRDGDYINQPVTGNFIHESNDVYDLDFKGSDKLMGVTGSHRIWSDDRKEWVTASKLRIGENVRTHFGSSQLLKRQKRKGSHKVYNLEIYKSHNYFVSLAKVLVHNDCWDDLADRLSKKIMEPNARIPQYTSHFKVWHESAYDASTRTYRILATTLQATGAANPMALRSVFKKMKQEAPAGAQRLIIKAQGLTTKGIKDFMKGLDGKSFMGFKVKYTEKQYGSMQVGEALLEAELK